MSKLKTLTFPVFTLCVVFGLNLFAQVNTKNYVIKNFYEIPSISLNDPQFKNFAEIGKSIGDSRIVLLGEQDHGDAATFFVKTQLVKYLHETKDFNVLAFESDFFGLNLGWDNLPKTDEKIRSFLKKNIYSIWSNCDACEDLLYNYIPKTFKTKKPLLVSGFDSQLTLDYSKTYLKKYIDSLLPLSIINKDSLAYYRQSFAEIVDSISISSSLSKHQFYSSILDRVEKRLDISQSRFGRQIFDNLRTNVNFAISFLSKTPNSKELRDAQMAKNLLWLLKYKFPNEKFIVWASNAHIVKRSDLAKVGRLQEKSMSQFITESAYRPKLYSIGFTSNNGIAGRLKTENYKILPALKNSFESWISESAKFGFLNLQSINGKNVPNEPFLMKGIGHYYNYAIWSKMYDGLFYIRDMYACKSLSEIQ